MQREMSSMKSQIASLGNSLARLQSKQSRSSASSSSSMPPFVTQAAGDIEPEWLKCLDGVVDKFAGAFGQPYQLELAS